MLIGTANEWALIDAVKRNNFNDVSVLIKAKTNLDVTDCDDHTALYWAIINKNIGIASILIQAGAKLDVVDRFSGQTALHHCVTMDEKDIGATIAIELIRAGVDLDVLEKFHGRTALHRASIYNRTSITKNLIMAGAKLDVVDDQGQTALHFAALYGHTEIATDLIMAGASLDLTDILGRTALHFAILRNDKPEKFIKIVASVLSKIKFDSIQKKDKHIEIIHKFYEIAHEKNIQLQMFLEPDLREIYESLMPVKISSIDAEYSSSDVAVSSSSDVLSSALAGPSDSEFSGGLLHELQSGKTYESLESLRKRTTRTDCALSGASISFSEHTTDKSEKEIKRQRIR